MRIDKIFIILFISSSLLSCADYNIKNTRKITDKKYYSSNGFALIFEEGLYKRKIVNKKISSDKAATMHNILKPNTLVKIINPTNSKFVETKINKKAEYPEIFNIVISKNIAADLELDVENPYVEIIEIKKNKKFVAKESNTFDEEKHVAEKAPVDEIKMDDLSKTKSKKSKKIDDSRYILVISDFYYETSAESLKLELLKKTKSDNIYIKKINSKKYRLFMGPFENFNALKTSYISLNNLGFENLNVYKE